MDWDDLRDALNRTIQSVGGEITSPWFYMQFGVILVAAGLSLALGSSLRARFDVTSLTMGWPAPLRLLARTVMQRAGTIIFALLAEISRVVMVQTGLLYRGYVLSTAVNLATAWLIIRLATSVIRNEFVVRVVSIAAWAVAALSIIGRLDDVSSALDSISITIGTLRLTPLVLIKAGVLLAVAMWLVSAAGNFIEARIARSRDLTPSVQVLLIKLVRVALIVAAIAMVMSAVGIDLSAFALFSGAIGVGLGFGLQKIIANFISGVILLADKSVKPGDLVTIGDSTGKISSMNTRYISVAAGDGREILIPNEDLVTQRVINWTYTDKTMLVKVNFATNYEADPNRVCELAVDIARNTQNVATFKAPNCLLTEFAETGMKFALTFWVADLDVGMDNVRSNVMQGLWTAFKNENIRVPYPVRELRVRSGALPVETILEVPSDNSGPAGKPGAE
ncbi:mechanosensitive ion channel [[Pseudomonas] carboxydohydrogena]|uniref:Mechanosensitive ion channel n=1 Tax=Afipia carboxydohydrogena TaxID=290 RepID=A0ABY8BUN9_AFICR|nr:mechanosensitive ion channel domain-containing protein [[Pseudomonas] carboxydohydrogena]WEF52037.1 mechanosensitive ion channel [[Pseudomonas] carboxydohydrogena]